MAFRQINVSPGEMYNSYAHVNDGLIQGIHQFGAELKDIAGKVSQANLMHKFNVSNWQQVFRDATPGSVDLAQNLAKIGMAHDEQQLEFAHKAAADAARASEDRLFENHGWDFLDSMARLQGSVSVPDHTVTEEIGGPDGEKRLGTYRVSGQTLWDPSKAVADLREAYKDMPLSKTAVAELSDILQKGYQNATQLAWRTMNDTTRRDLAADANETKVEIAGQNNQTRKDIAATKASGETADAKDVIAFNSKQRLLASENGVGYDELKPDATGRLQPPERVRSAGGWDAFKASNEMKKQKDRLAYERETRLLVQDEAQNFEREKAKIAAESKDADVAQKEIAKRYADLRRRIHSDLTEKTIYAFDEKGKPANVRVPGDKPGEAYWRRLAPYTTKDIMAFAVSQSDEYGYFTWLIKRNMNEGGGIAPSIPPSVQMDLAQLKVLAETSTDAAVKAYAQSIVKTATFENFKKFLDEARKVDAMAAGAAK